MAKIEFRLEALLTLETGDLELRDEEKEEIRKILETKLPDRVYALVSTSPRLLPLSHVRLSILGEG